MDSIIGSTLSARSFSCHYLTVRTSFSTSKSQDSIPYGLTCNEMAPTAVDELV